MSDDIRPIDLLNVAIQLYGPETVRDADRNTRVSQFVVANQALLDAAFVLKAGQDVELLAGAWVNDKISEIRQAEERAAYVSIDDFYREHSGYQNKEDATKLLRDFLVRQYENKPDESGRGFIPDTEAEVKALALLNEFKGKGIPLKSISKIMAFKETRMIEARSKGGKMRQAAQ